MEHLQGPEEAPAAAEHRRQLAGEEDDLTGAHVGEGGEEARESTRRGDTQGLVTLTHDLRAGVLCRVGVDRTRENAFSKGVSHVAILHGVSPG